jgi:hypothetical protein
LLLEYSNQFLESHKAANKPSLELKKVAASTAAALIIGSSVLTNPIIADAVETQPFTFSSTNIVAEKVVRQGMYQDYEVDLTQSVDDATSSFKSAKETKTKKGTYHGLEDRYSSSNYSFAERKNPNVAHQFGQQENILQFLLFW